MKTATRADKPTSKEAIGKRLDVAREALGIETNVKFAKSVNRSPQQWSNYVTGGNYIPVDAAVELRKRYRLSLDWIYAGDTSALPLALANDIERVEKERAAAAKNRRRK